MNDGLKFYLLQIGILETVEEVRKYRTTNIRKMLANVSAPKDATENQITNIKGIPYGTGVWLMKYVNLA